MTRKEFEKDGHEFNKLVKKIRRKTGEAIAQFNMIEEGDRIMVCMSGGKDSFAMLDILRAMQINSPVKYTLVAVNLDQKQPGFPAHILPAYFESIGIEYRIVERDTYSIVKRLVPEGQTTCSVCSRLRRGILYSTADELGANKIALGHHRDDILQTLFLNLFHGGILKAMPPKLVSDDGKHVVIRPMAFCSEDELERYADEKKFPIIPCDLCGSQPDLERQNIKQMLKEWEKKHPQRLHSMFRALQNVKPSHLADTSIYDFNSFSRIVDEDFDVCGPIETAPPVSDPARLTKKLVMV